MSNIQFIVRNTAPGTPESIFLYYYPCLFHSPWRLTVTGFSQAIESGRKCWILEDCYGTRYRLFMQTEDDLLTFSHGSTHAGDEDDIIGHIPTYSPEELTEYRIPYIRVFRKDGSIDRIQKGATALDFAFHLNPNIGLCAVNATINHTRVRVPLYTRLAEGDLVEIHSDYDRAHPERNVYHATIRWIEYLRTDSARKTLTRWLETNTDRMGFQNIVVYSPKMKPEFRREIPIGSTVLDYMLLVHGSSAFEGFEVFLNESPKPADLRRVLRYEDVLTVRLQIQGGARPEIGWFSIVKTAGARKLLVDYFRNH